jgi:hypothetical protein
MLGERAGAFAVENLPPRVCYPDIRISVHIKIGDSNSMSDAGPGDFPLRPA